MESLYDQKAVEARWQEIGEDEGLYEADPDAPGETFVVMHPPPNISGSLTIGHCLQLSLEDALVRYHRMRGFNTLFQPGYDHGGISTWAAIGRELAKEGKTQRDLGREGFDEYARAGSSSTAARSWARSACSAPRSTGAASGSRWTRALPRGPALFVRLYERG